MNKRRRYKAKARRRAASRWSMFRLRIGDVFTIPMVYQINPLPYEQTAEAHPSALSYGRRRNPRPA